MIQYLARRLFLLVFTLFILTLIAYGFYHHVHDGKDLTYFEYIGRLSMLDFGVSDITGENIRQALWQYTPATIELVMVGLFLALCIGIPLGTLAGVYYRKSPDQLISSSAIIGSSLPTFWLGMLLMMVLSLHFGGLFPSIGRLNPLYDVPVVSGFLLLDTLLWQSPYRFDAWWDALSHLMVPAIVIAIFPATEIIRQMRSVVNELLQKPFIAMAETKGLSRWQIIRRHVLRNALVMITPVLGLQFGYLLTNTMVTELVFDWPGLGRWLVQSISIGDYRAIEGCLIVVSSLVIVVSISNELLSVLMSPLERKSLNGRR